MTLFSFCLRIYIYIFYIYIYIYRLSYCFVFSSILVSMRGNLNPVELNKRSIRIDCLELKTDTTNCKPNEFNIPLELISFNLKLKNDTAVRKNTGVHQHKNCSHVRAMGPGLNPAKCNQFHTFVQRKEEKRTREKER